MYCTYLDGKISIKKRTSLTSVVQGHTIKMLNGRFNNHVIIGLTRGTEVGARRTDMTSVVLGRGL